MMKNKLEKNLEKKLKYKLIINLKTYKEGTGLNALKFAKIIKELEFEAFKKNVEIILCGEILDLRVLIATNIKIYSQHIDNFDYGAHTGYIIPESLKEAGALGTLINHSEHRISLDTISEDIKKSKKIGFETCVCVKDDKEIKKVLKYKPDFIALEPTELIGGDISISSARPELISNSVKVSKDIPILVGAGVKNSKDVRKAIELGSKGILVASGVVKASNPKEIILDLLSGF